MEFTLCVMLWARPGMADALCDYEDEVLELLADHGAVVRSRGRLVAGAAAPGAGEGSEDVHDVPDEVQLLDFPSEDAFAAFLTDDRRAGLADRRDAAVERTLMWRVQPR